MTLRIFTFALLFFVTIDSFSQQKDTSFSKEWLHIDTLILHNGLTKTALAQVNQLYNKAVAKNLPAQKIKCLIYRYSLESIVTEKGPVEIAGDLQKEINTNHDPVVQSLLRLLLAKELQQYLQNNRWDIYNRKTVVNNQSPDINTWTIDDFRKNIAIQFEKIQQQIPLLQKITLDTYDAILIRGSKKYNHIDLADLCLREAITFYKSGDFFVSKTIDYFSIQNPKALSDLTEFVQLHLPVTDTNAHQFITLQLYQQLLKKHIADKDPTFLLEINLERIEWVYQEGKFPNKEQLYEHALTTITTKYPSEQVTAGYWLAIASVENTRGRTYAPFKDTTHRFALVKAKKIIDNALNTFNDSLVAVQKMKQLLSEIKQQQWNTKTEQVNLIDKKFRAWISYKNIDTLYIRILQNRNNLEEPETWQNTFWKKIVTVTPFKTLTLILPRTDDHQMHSVEIVLPELPFGEYELLCSNSTTFNDSLSKLSYQRFKVSNISYIKNRNDIFVVHRETGRPLANVSVSVLQNTYNRELKKYQYKVLAKKQTDKNGYLNLIEKNQGGAYKYIFETKNDKLASPTDEYEYYYDPITNLDISETTKRLLFFTDRSIYRPGQSVFFKAIGILTDNPTKQSKINVTKDSIWVFLQNANGKKIDSARYQMNSFGSFSGSFRLPLQGLTGNFSLLTQQKNLRSSIYFSVEEYKRPTFSVSLEKPKTAYQLNDSITITGNAKAFSGNNIDGAKVVYTVTRDSRYRYPWFWRGPISSNEKREISHGELISDASGNFKISFKASADDIEIKKEANPLFDFTINTSVTDINGETRTANTTITTGITSLQISLTVPEIVDAIHFKEIPVQTTNLSDEKEDALVQVKITALQHPERLIKKRLWERPDQFLLSEKDFISQFPFDEYDDESNPATWLKGSLIQQAEINTKNTGIFTLNSPLQAGHYEIEASTKDKNGHQVNTVVYFKVMNSLTKKMASPDYQFILAKKQTVEPGDTALFIHAMSANELFVIRKTERAFKKAVIDYQYRKKGFTDIVFSPTEEDRGGMMITEAYVIHNRMYTHEYSINVPWTNKQLDIRYSSYRDKTEPGSQEKWTITVKSKSGEKTDAELLTGMYDASLDQFKQHQWTQPLVWQTNRWRNQFNAGNNFITIESVEKYFNNNYFVSDEETQDRIAMHADELIEQNIRSWIKNPTTLLSIKLKTRLALELEDVAVTPFQTQRKKSQVYQYTLAGVAGGVSIDKVSAFNTLEEVSEAKRDFAEEKSPIRIRGNASSNIVSGALIVVDGVIVSDVSKIDPSDILSMENLESSEAIKRFGQRAEKGAVIITTKNNQTTPVTIRKNFNETAFFYPHLLADSAGNYSFSFTMPDALTQWKWMTLAHTKDLALGSTSTNIITQKTLMVQANAPRFMREGDKMEFSAKVSNLSDQELSGQIMLELIDANAGSSVDGWFQNVFPVQYFTVPAKQSSIAKFPIQIPFSFNRALTWRLVAKAGNYSDGEENILPVLTNRQLVTESLPIMITKDTTQAFRFDKLIDANSPSLTHEALTISYTANPIWEAIRSLPYLMEYPYECAEQTFNRFYANALAHYIINKDPKIKKVFEVWQRDTTSLKSKLQLNESLKQVMLEETPWVFEAESQEQKNKNLALLFDVFRLNQQTEQLINKLQEMQLPDGSFSWFKGGYSDRYMTNYIMTGIGKLKRLGAITPDVAIRLKPVIDNAIKFLDATITKDYRALKAAKLDSIKPMLSGFELQYLYMRSFFRDIQQTSTSDAYSYYYELGKNNIQKQNIYNKALLGLIYFRNNEKRFVNVNILNPILENVVEDKAKATIYWKDRSGYSWFTSQTEHQSTVIQFLQEILKDQNFVGGQKSIDHARNWLLLNKQTNHWNTTIATADAAYALIMTGTDLLHTDKNITVRLGNTVYNNQSNTKEAGTGFFQQRVEGRLIKPEMGNIQVSVQTKGNAPTESLSWGAVHWQYFEDMDKITPSATPLSITKELFIEKNSNSGKVLEALKENAVVKPGDKVIVRIIIKSDRAMEYIHLKDTRSATMEPVNVLSGFKWQDRLGYYESTKDASTNFFIGQLNKGTYVFDYPVYITHTGVFSTGNASIQCMYAPEFTANSGGMILRVEE